MEADDRHLHGNLKEKDWSEARCVCEPCVGADNAVALLPAPWISDDRALRECFAALAAYQTWSEPLGHGEADFINDFADEHMEALLYHARHQAFQSATQDHTPRPNF